jgi:hypothetical protein
MGGPERAPQSPRGGSGHPGAAVAPLERLRAPSGPPNPPGVARDTPAPPWRPSKDSAPRAGPPQGVWRRVTTTWLATSVP